MKIIWYIFLKDLICFVIAYMIDISDVKLLVLNIECHNTKSKCDWYNDRISLNIMIL